MEIQNNSDFTWLINSTEIRPGGSAIIGNNRLAFFAIHHIALCTITVSLVSSLIVIKVIHSKWKNSTSKLDFPVRFPLYLAVADTLWGISHFTDHIYLVTVQTYPNSSVVKNGLSMNLWFFFGYQQLMHMSIAGYTYLRVVHRKRLNLGKWEWKLHLAWFSFLIGTIILFYFTDSFGNTGYWMAHDPRTINGQILGVVIAITSTSNAVITTLGYYMIKRTVVKIKNKIKVNAPGQDNLPRRHQSIASRCLTTYVTIASFLYCPLAIIFWINILFQIVENAIEPVSCLLICIVANCSGWANAYGYFHNEKLKKEKCKGKVMSSNPNSTDNTFNSNTSSDI